MPWWKEQRGGTKFDLEAIDLAGNQACAMLERIAIARADDAVHHVEFDALREVLVRRINVDQFGGEVCIERVGGSPKSHNDGASHFERFLQRFALERENVVP